MFSFKKKKEKQTQTFELCCGSCVDGLGQTAELISHMCGFMGRIQVVMTLEFQTQYQPPPKILNTFSDTAGDKTTAGMGWCKDSDRITLRSLSSKLCHFEMSGYETNFLSSRKIDCIETT